MKNNFAALLCVIAFCSFAVSATELSESVKLDYEEYLAPLWDHFHRNPELSFAEFRTAERMAKELSSAGFEVTAKVGGTGVVAILRNGDGPFVMMRADMDGLPVEEKTGMPNASKVRQVDPTTGDTVPVMHACGHDVHITSLVGTARQMVTRIDEWNGTLMLIAQPAEERGLGARMMRDDNLWGRFGTPDYALAFHVSAGEAAGKINAPEGAIYVGADSVDIIVHGIGSHGASPHRGKDPVLIGSQIVIALQTLVSRELSPRVPGVVTVGSFHAGQKHNIISDKAHLQLTVRNTNEKTRKILLEGIERIAINTARAAGIPEDKLPQVIISDARLLPTINDTSLTRRLKGAWAENLGEDVLFEEPPQGMGAEDFPWFTANTEIKSVYWSIGGTPQEDMDAEKAGIPTIAGHHSPLFQIASEPAVRVGVESTVVALLELMGNQEPAL